MAAKKTAPKKPVNKSAFVRSLPKTMPGADVVKKAKAEGINISLAYVYGIRSKSHAKKRPPASTAAAPVAKRGPGRSPKLGNGSPTRAASGGLVAEIERVVEAKVNALLKSKLGALFG